jgi:hypothetical protein
MSIRYVKSHGRIVGSRTGAVDSRVVPPTSLHNIVTEVNRP